MIDEQAETTTVQADAKESDNSENFLKGCYLDEADGSFKKLEEERTSKMKSDIRDSNNWDWEYIDRTYQGVTLKHVYDMMDRYKNIQYEKDCPTPF